MTFAVFVCALVLGVVAAIAPVGPVTILVLRRCLAGNWRGALKVGLGRMVPETLYCGLATFGTAALIKQYPGARLTIESIGTGLLFVIGTWFVSRNHAPDTQAHDASSRKGDWAGFFLSAVNPTLLLSWSAISAVAISISGIEPTIQHKIAFPLGIGTGIACGYVGLIWTLHRFDDRLNANIISSIIRVIGAGFVALSIWNALKLLEVV